MTLQIKIVLLSTFKNKKHQRPRKILYTPSWSWGQAYSSLNSAKLIQSSEATLTNIPFSSSIERVGKCISAYWILTNRLIWRNWRWKYTCSQKWKLSNSWLPIIPRKNAFSNMGQNGPPPFPILFSNQNHNIFQKGYIRSFLEKLFLHQSGNNNYRTKKESCLSNNWIGSKKVTK